MNATESIPTPNTSAPLHLDHLAPVLVVDAVEPCVRFWADRLGFTVENQVPGPDGTLVFAQGGEERQRQLAQHVTQVYRIASATLARAGLGALRRGVVEGVAEMTFLRSDGGVILGVSLPHDVEVGAGLVQVGRLWTDLNIKA